MQLSLGKKDYDAGKEIVKCVEREKARNKNWEVKQVLRYIISRAKFARNIEVCFGFGKSVFSLPSSIQQLLGVQQNGNTEFERSNLDLAVVN